MSKSKQFRSSTGWSPFDSGEEWAQKNIPGYYKTHKPHPDYWKKLRKKQVAQSIKSIERRKNLIARLAERDGGQICFYCKKELEFEDCTLDHVIPKSKGGRNVFDNYVIACSPCNQEKGDTMNIGEIHTFNERMWVVISVSKDHVVLEAMELWEGETEKPILDLNVLA